MMFDNWEIPSTFTPLRKLAAVLIFAAACSLIFADHSKIFGLLVVAANVLIVFDSYRQKRRSKIGN